MKVQNIIVIDGKEIDMKELTEEKRLEIANHLNRIALRHLGYEPTKDKTA